jgi:hypothetical protein
MTDPTAAIEVWARMLCAADVHVHDGDHPTWQQLVGEPGSRIRDDYRKAAAWLLPRLTVAATPAVPAPATGRDTLREQLLHALDFAYCQGIGYSTPEALLAAYDASRVVQAAAVDRDTLRERIAEALYERERPPRDPKWADAYAMDRETFEAMADVVLAVVLPAPTDQTAEFAEQLVERCPDHGCVEPAWEDGCHCEIVPLLCGLAGEAQQDEARVAPWASDSARIGRALIWSWSDVGKGEFGRGYRAAQEEARAILTRALAREAQQDPTQDGEAEKLAKARRMAKAMSAPLVKPAQLAANAEWPMRHKRSADRRVHATAPFLVNGTQQIWTACEKHVGPGGYPLNHMPVDCRDCKRALAADAPTAVAGPGQPETD